MLKTLGIVQACCDSERFHSNLSRRLGGQSLLGWVVRRVTDATRLDGVIVVARGDSPCSASRLAALVPADVPLFLSDAPNASERFLAALERYPADAVVRVCGDSALVDPGLIDRLVTSAESHPDCDYITFAARDGRPAILSSVGIFAEWFRAKALRKATRGDTGGDPEQVTQPIFARPDRFRIRLLQAPDRLDRDDVRLTVDHEEDWENVLTIIEALGPEHLDWQRIAELLDHQPALRQRMADLNRLPVGAP